MLTLLAQTAGEAEALSRAMRLALATAGLLGAVVLGLALLVAARRAAVRRRNALASRQRQRTIADAWSESARRLKMDPEEPGPNDETVDLGPSDPPPYRP